MISSPALILLVGSLLFNSKTLAKKLIYNKHADIEKDALKDFVQIYYATKDLSGNEGKTEGAPPFFLQAVGERLSLYLPEVRRHSAGCIVPANDISGPSNRGSYDLLLGPNTDYGQCMTPSEVGPMKWKEVYPNHKSFEQRTNLPPVEAVWEAIFKRQGPGTPVDPETVSLNFWFLSFVNWFHDDNFKSLPGTDGTYVWSDDGGMRLSQIYGHTKERQISLRLGRSGKMKTQTIGKWEYFPPSVASVRVVDPSFSMWTPESGPHGTTAAANKTDSTVDLNSYFAIGDPRFNMHPGQIMWASIALYLHNSACDAILSSDPELNDEEVFQRARVIVFHLVQTTRLHNFISDSVSHARDHFRIPYDPANISADLGRFLNFKGGQPNFMEFNHIYQAWHSFVPDSLRIGVDEVSMIELMWKPHLFHTNSLSAIAAGFTKTPIAKYGPHSYLPFLKDITIQTLRNERSQRMQSYNSYRVNFGLDPLTSFDQLGVKDPVLISKLYNDDIDQLELLPGILADNIATIPENLLGDMQLITVAVLAVQDLVSNEIVSNPVLWSEEFLTVGGANFLRQYDFADVLELLLDGEIMTPSCVFRTSDEGCTPQKRFVPFSESTSCFMCNSGICSYLGIDLTSWFYDENGYMRAFLISATFSCALVAMLYVCLLAGIRFLFVSKRKHDNDQNPEHILSLGRLRLVVLAANTLVTLGLATPLTLFWVNMVSRPDWIEGLSEGSYHSPAWGAGFVSAAFLAEIILRLAREDVLSMLYIVVHHMGYYYFALAVYISSDVLVFKISITLLCGFVWEWPMFLSYLVLRAWDLSKMGSNGPSAILSSWYCCFIKYGMPSMIAIYFATRILETVSVVRILICGAQRYFAKNLTQSSPFWIVTPIAPLPLLLQYHAGWVMIKMWGRRTKQLRQEEARKSTQTATLSFVESAPMVEEE